MLYQIIALLLWSSAFIAAKYTFTMMDPALMLLFRLGIASLLALPPCLRYWRQVEGRHWKGLLWMSFWNYVVVMMLEFVGAKTTSAASATTILGLSPILTVFIGHFFFYDRAHWSVWLCGVAAFAGVALLIAGGGEGGEVGLWGSALVFAGNTVFCAVLRPTQDMIKKIGVSAFTSISMAVAPLLCLPATLVFADSLHIDWNWKGTLGLVYLGVCCSWLAYNLWNIGMKTVPANVSGILSALGPIFGAWLAVLILGERISALSWLGIVLVVAATLAAVWVPKWLKRRQATGGFAMAEADMDLAE
ncbi:DMT family transporter [Eikenella sp. Marseille-P7795]|uniref:DMT family transporter n=1 Tax=Eikenella sp. Marseille-P7795 TaxID=2866577 RepID=UPI001CE4A67A|nr:EamA family transporter [Eikenella sp. Marseille-P7795]